MCARLSALLTILLLLMSLPSATLALPWDRDMYRQPSYKAGEMPRAPAKNTVPLGYKPYKLTLEQAQGLSNPVPFSLFSVWRGQRMYNANCYTCHGKKADGAGPVGPQMGVPSLLTDFYREKPDGIAYHVLQVGGVNMPRYGFKFSEEDRWHVVNYLRFLQGKDVEGMTRPH